MHDFALSNLGFGNAGSRYQIVGSRYHGKDETHRDDLVNRNLLLPIRLRRSNSVIYRGRPNYLTLSNSELGKKSKVGVLTRVRVGKYPRSRKASEARSSHFSLKLEVRQRAHGDAHVSG